MQTSDWVYSQSLGQTCQLVNIQHLWGLDQALVWLPTQNTLTRLPLSDLTVTQPSKPWNTASITWRATAARLSDALAQENLLAPLGAGLIPLPHQLRALQKALGGNQVRYLLADEVGLGKTIEAGLILRELKLRGRARRILVVAPKGIAPQWVAEMRLRFNETFRLLLPGEFQGLIQQDASFNLFGLYDQVVVPMDSVKPLEKRRGWSQEQVQAYNRQRFEGLISAGWDLIIVDEAHRLGGSTDQVARFRLGQGLAGASPYFLMLSATPHQGKRDAFHRLVSLLDEETFPDSESVNRERVQPFVIRTEKRQAIDAEGQPLFKPRYTRRIPVAWQSSHLAQQRLYAAVSEYVREGYNQARREKRNYIGFLMTLVQRLVTSSTRAIRVTLERRLEVLRQPEEQLNFFAALEDDEWNEMDGQEQADTLVRTRMAGLKNEVTEVELLLETARRTEAQGADAKAEALLDWLYRLQQEESDPDLKALIFTEFVPTQEMLAEFLNQRGFSIVCLNGSMNMEERQRAQNEFAKSARILVSTDAGGEGLNLQFCHVVVNYDIPWNPMRMEQRIGRVDRIGQAYPVRALNFILQDTVEYRVLEVLEEKLKIILAEFGVDKAADVLDSAEAEELFDNLYRTALLNPQELEQKADEVARQVQEQARADHLSGSLLGSQGRLDTDLARQAQENPLPYWVERMVIAYLQAEGGRADAQQNTWQLAWSDGSQTSDVVFNGSDAQQNPAAYHLTIQDERTRKILDELPALVPGQPLPRVTIPDMPANLQGVWSLWRIRLSRPDLPVEMHTRQNLALFLNENGRAFLPTGRAIWEKLVAQDAKILGWMDGDNTRSIYEQSRQAAEAQGKSIYEQLLARYRATLENERQKAEYAFAARRKTIARIGLPAVRQHRLNILEQEHRQWQIAWQQRPVPLPELDAFLILIIDGDNYP